MFGGHFREHTKTQQKRPKFAGPNIFHAHVYLEVILESAQKRNKKGPNCLPDLFPRTCIFRCLYTKFLWQFLLISLLCSLRAWIIQIKIFFEFLRTYHALEAWEHSQACTLYLSDIIIKVWLIEKMCLYKSFILAKCND